MRQSQGYVKVEVPYLPTLKYGMRWKVFQVKMGSIKATNKVVRFDYGKVKSEDIAWCI